MKRESNYNDKGDRVNSRDDGGYTCRTDKDRGTCTNNRTGEKVDVVRNNDNSWSIDTSNTGSKNRFGSNYPSNFRDDKDTGGGYSGNSGGNFESESSQYGLDNLKELPRIANEKEFAATCHGSIAVNSIIDHAITRNSLGHGANALASLKTLNLSHNYLSDGHAKILNDGLYGYTLNLQSFNFCNNKIGPIGLDFLVKGSIGMDHLQKGGNDINNMMQGMLTLPTTSIVCLNLANNNIGDIGADILGHALVNGKLPATKNIDVSGNNITEKGHIRFMEALESPNVKSIMISLVQNITDFQTKVDKALKSTVDFVTKGLKYTIEQHNKDMKGTKWDGTTVRTDNLDKWKNCKEVGQNVQKGFIGGLIKCGSTPKTPHAMFACVLKDVGMELLDPDTIWCAVEVNEFVKETEVIGENCNIF